MDKLQSLRPLKQFRTLTFTVACLVVSPMLAQAQTEIVRRDVIDLDLIDQVPEQLRVYLNDIDVTAFVTVEDSTVRFQNPFPESRRSFSLTAVDDSSGQVVFAQRYRHARPGELFDRIEVTGSGQLDSSYVNSDESNSFFEQEETDVGTSGMGSTETMVGGVDVAVQRGPMAADLSFEALNTTDADATLRYAGPSADVSRFRLQSSLETQAGSRFRLSAGDIDLYSENELVNTGIASRGLSVGFATADQRLSFEIGRLFGSDIVGAVKGPVAWSEDSYRVGARLDATLVQHKWLDWSVHGSVLDLQRPAADNFGIAETPDAEKNNVRGLGTRFSLFSDRVRLKMDWADSTYDNPFELSVFDAEPVDASGQEIEIFSPGETTGKAWRHSLGWNAWSGQIKDRPASLSMTLGTEQASPLYRSVHGSATADRRQRSAVLDGYWSFISLQYSDTRFRNNLDNLVSIHTLDESIQSVNLNFDLQSYSDDTDYADVTSQELLVDQSSDESALIGDVVDSNNSDQITDAQVSNESSEYLIDNNDGAQTQGSRSSWLSTFKPTQISLSGQRQDVKTLNGDVIILAPVIEGLDFVDQTTESINLALSWASNTRLTTLDIGYSFLDIDQRERAQADRRDNSYSISHEIFGDRWRLGGRIGFNYTDDLDPTTRSKFSLAEGGLSASYQTDFGISIAGSADYSSNDLTDFVSDGSSRTRSERFGLSLDFGNLVRRMLNLKTFPSLSAAWQKSESTSTSEFDSFNTSSSSMLINLGLSF